MPVVHAHNIFTVPSCIFPDNHRLGLAPGRGSLVSVCRGVV